MTKNRKKIGILGGTFNPIHLGHLRAAEDIREILDLAKIYFIPANIPPHKDPAAIAPPTDRLKMIEIGTQGNPFFEVSDLELKRTGPSYTVDTLEYFSSSFPEYECYFILGTDLFSEIDTWKSYKRLFTLSNFAIIVRPGFENDFYSMCPLALRNEFRYYRANENIITYRHTSSKVLVLAKIERIQISSTEIRELIRARRSIKYLVPTDVESYILSRKLYSKEENQ